MTKRQNSLERYYLNVKNITEKKYIFKINDNS